MNELIQDLVDDDRVCEFHFEDEDVLRFDKFFDEEGRCTAIVHRDRYKLRSSEVIPKAVNKIYVKFKFLKIYIMIQI